MDKNTIAAIALVFIGIIAAYLITKEDNKSLLSNIDKTQYDTTAASGGISSFINSFLGLKTKGLAAVSQANQNISNANTAN